MTGDNTALNVIEPDVFDSVKQNALTVLSNAKEMALKVKDDSSFLEASELRKTINKWKKEAIEQIEPLRKKAHATYQEVLRQRDLAVEPLDEALKVLDPAISMYYAEQQRLAQIEQEKAQAEAKRQQEEAILRQAEVAQKAGKTEKAEAILNKPIITPKVEMPKPAQANGVSFRETWSVNPEIDVMQLAKAVVNGKVPVNAIVPNMTFLNSMARALKNGMNYPGVTVQMEKNVASTRK